MLLAEVRDLAADGIPVAVTCRVLTFSKQAFYAWRAQPVSQRDWDDAHLLNAALDIHAADPDFGYRFTADELTAEHGISAGENRVQRLCSAPRLWSLHSKKHGLNRKAAPPVHDDLVGRQSVATRPNQLWRTDLTEHRTAEGKLYVCAIRDDYSRKIVGYAIGDRMKADLAVRALRNAIALRKPVRTLVHSERGSQGGLNRSSQYPVISEVFNGTTSAAGGSGSATGYAFARPADAGEVCGARVLAPDCAGRRTEEAALQLGVSTPVTMPWVSPPLER